MMKKICLAFGFALLVSGLLVKTIPTASVVPPGGDIPTSGAVASVVPPGGDIPTTYVG